MYNDFALIYDRFQEIDYDEFIEFYNKILGGGAMTIIDLGCGTGEITYRLAGRGHNVIGVDISEEMLTAAQDKALSTGANIMFIKGDMTEFVYGNGADAVISSLDCVNYLTDISEVKAAFECVYKSLNPGGVFIFDINSGYKLKNILGDNTFVYEDEDAYCVWDCAYFDEDKICSFDLNFFVRGSDGRFDRYYEYQEERAYSIEEITAALKSAGFKDIEVYSDLTMSPPNEKSERIFFAAQ